MADTVGILVPAGEWKELPPDDYFTLSNSSGRSVFLRASVIKPTEIGGGHPVNEMRICGRMNTLPHWVWVDEVADALLHYTADDRA